MSSTPNALPADSQQLHRTFSRFRTEFFTLVIAGVSLFVASVALLIAAMSIGSSSRSEILAEFVEKDYRAQVERQNNSIALLRVYVEGLHSDMKARGFNPPPLPEIDNNGEPQGESRD